MEITKIDPTLKFRKKLSEKMSNKNGEIDRESVMEVLDEDFHSEFREELKQEYLKEYNDIQDIARSMNVIEKIQGDEQFSEETRTKILSVSSLATLFQLYNVYYSVVMN